jgi:hypothetical protein
MKLSKMFITLSSTIIVAVALQYPFFIQQKKLLAQSLSSQQIINYPSDNKNENYGTISSPDFENAFNYIVKQQGYSIKTIAFTPQGGFVIIYTALGQIYPIQFHFYSKAIPQEAINELNTLVSQNYTIEDIQFTPKGGFAILFNYGFNHLRYYTSSDFPPALANDLKAVINSASSKSARINRILFPPQGGVAVVTDDNGFVYSNDTPQDIAQQFNAIAQLQTNINSIAFTPQGGLFASLNSLTKPVYSYGNIPQTFTTEVQKLRASGNIYKTFPASVIAFSPSNDWVFVYNK